MTEGRPHRSTPLRIALLLGAAAALIAVQIFLPEPNRGPYWSDLFNAGHAPLYGLVALAVLTLLRGRFGGVGRSPVRPYLAALGLTVAAGVLAEGIQALGIGDPELGDVVRDALGASAFLLAAAAYDRGWERRGRRPPRRGPLIAAVLILLPAFFPLAATEVAVLQRDREFPDLCDFDRSWSTRFFLLQEADLERTPPPEGWRPAPPGRVARLRFHPGTYPGISLRNVHQNWTGYHALGFDVYSELPAPVALHLSVYDIHHKWIYHDQFNRELSIAPGVNRISIPLRDVQAGPRDRNMDLSRMYGLVLHASHPDRAFDLYLDGFRLE